MITPLFTSAFSLDSGSLLTLEEPGKAKLGAPLSIFDLAADGGLKDVTLVDERIDGFTAAYKTAARAGVKLCYGIKLAVVQDSADKTPLSLSTESKVIIFLTNTQAYHDLIRIWNRAWTDGYFTHRGANYGRIDWRTLKSLWTPNLMLALPFFSSFLARNTLTFRKIVPDLPDGAGREHPLIVFREKASELPFAPLIDAALDRFDGAGRGIETVQCKTVYYNRRSDFKAYQIKRCIAARTTWDAPEVAHMASSAFSWESYKEQLAKP